MLKQSEKINEASKWAIEKLKALSTEELKELLRNRELGPVGKCLVETGTVKLLIEECQRRKIKQCSVKL